jgi:single-strand DNA-binding protein
MNNVTLIGNLATDVTMRETQSGKQVASFKVAVNRFGQDNGADFIWVKTWNGSAENCAKYLSKGKKVAIEGQIRTSRVQSEGEFKDYFEVNANRVTFLTPKPADGEAPVNEDENIPAAVEVISEAPREEDITPAAETSKEAPADDDIPF